MTRIIAVNFPKSDYDGSHQGNNYEYSGGGVFDDSDGVKGYLEHVNLEPSGWGEYLNQRRRDSEMMPQGPHRENHENSRHPFDTASGGGEGGYGGGYGGGNEGGNGGGHQSGGGYWGDSRTGYADWARGNRH